MNTVEVSQIVGNESVNTVSNKEARQYGDFGNGRFSKVMRELYSDCQELLSIKQEHADKIARQFGADCGRIDKAGIGSVKIGNLKKEQITLKATIDTLKGVIPTHSILIAKQIELVKALKVHGVSDVSINWVESIQIWVFGE